MTKRILLSAVLCLLPAFAFGQPVDCEALYNRWRENYNGDAAKQKTAYETGREFSVKCTSMTDYLPYVQRWMVKYEAASQQFTLKSEFDAAAAAQDGMKIIETGKKILAAEPENLQVLAIMAGAGMSAKNKASATDSAAPARLALKLIEAGKADARPPEFWKSLTGYGSDKAETIGALQFALSYYLQESEPAQAAAFARGAIARNPVVRSSSSVYYYLFAARLRAEFEPLQKDYAARCAGKPATAECDALAEKMKPVIDRLIDPLARAISLNKDAARGAEWRKTIEELYRFRHDGKTEGLDALIAGIMARPMPDDPASK